jgi:hypothetical protein
VSEHLTEYCVDSAYLSDTGNSVCFNVTDEEAGMTRAAFLDVRIPVTDPRTRRKR